MTLAEHELKIAIENDPTLLTDIYAILLTIANTAKTIKDAKILAKMAVAKLDGTINHYLKAGFAVEFVGDYCPDGLYRVAMFWIDRNGQRVWLRTITNSTK